MYEFTHTCDLPHTKSSDCITILAIAATSLAVQVTVLLLQYSNIVEDCPIAAYSKFNLQIHHGNLEGFLCPLYCLACYNSDRR